MTNNEQLASPQPLPHRTNIQEQTLQRWAKGVSPFEYKIPLNAFLKLRRSVHAQYPKPVGPARVICYKSFPVPGWEREENMYHLAEVEAQEVLFSGGEYQRQYIFRIDGADRTVRFQDAAFTSIERYLDDCLDVVAPGVHRPNLAQYHFEQACAAKRKADDPTEQTCLLIVDGFADSLSGWVAVLTPDGPQINGYSYQGGMWTPGSSGESETLYLPQYPPDR